MSYVVHKNLWLGFTQFGNLVTAWTTYRSMWAQDTVIFDIIYITLIRPEIYASLLRLISKIVGRCNAPSLGFFYWCIVPLEMVVDLKIFASYLIVEQLATPYHLTHSNTLNHNLHLYRKHNGFMVNMICQILLEDIHWKENNSHKLDRAMKMFHLCQFFCTNFFSLHDQVDLWLLSTTHKTLQLEGDLPIWSNKFSFGMPIKTCVLSNRPTSVRVMCKSTTRTYLQFFFNDVRQLPGHDASQLP